MERIKSFILDNKYSLIILFLWCMIVSVSAINHELWRDEAQAWCLVRDLPFLDVFKMIRIEGHPVLWYILLYPFAKLGFPVEAMQCLSFGLVFITLILLLFKSSLNNAEKIVTVFSAGMIYYMPVVARSYSIAPLLIFLLAYFYPQRKESPVIYSILIVLLSHTHNYLLGFSGILFLLFVIESLKERNVLHNILSFFVSLNFLFIFMMFRGVSAENYILQDANYSKIPLIEIVPFVGKVVTFDIFNSLNFHNVFTDWLGILSFLVPLILFACYFYRCDKKVFIIYTFSIGFMLFVFSKIYLFGLLYQKIFLMYLITIFCYWIRRDTSSEFFNLVKYAFIILFCISTIVGAILLKNDYKHNFSGSKQMANYIKTHLNDEKVFAAYGNPYVYSAISAYLPDKKFYNPLSESYISYFSYEKNISKKTATFPENAKYFIIQDKGYNVEELGFNIVFETDSENLSSVAEKEVFKLCIE